MSRFSRLGWLSSLSLLALSSAAAAAADVHAEQAWARAARQGAATSAAYVRIANHGAEPDRLLSVATDVAQRAELHEHRDEHGMMRMRPIPSLALAAGDTVDMQPLGAHIMLFGVNRRLSAGTQFTLHLRFERAGEIAVPVTVKPLDYLPAGEPHHHH